MIFLLDESADFRLGAFLTGEGHQVVTVSGDIAPGLVDTEVLQVARRGGMVLITNDPDFGELIVRRGLPHSGVILFRLKTTDLATKIDRLAYVLREYHDHLDQFLVVTERRVRIRRRR